jgi:hypothetical protein
VMERIVRVAIDLERRSGRVYQGEWLASVAQSHAEILVLHFGLGLCGFARIFVCNLKRRTL